MHTAPADGNAPPPAGACRVCGEASWLSDDAGPVHLCCRRWEAERTLPSQACPACAQAHENATASQRRRRPRLLAWPPDATGGP
jgi:hypothetical protein